MMPGRDAAGMNARFARMLGEALPPEQRNIPSLLDSAARRHPGKVHVRIGARAITYSESRERAARVAGQLVEQGVRPGDRVALMCRNRVEFIDFFYGCFWARAIVVPINPALRGAQLAHVLNLCGAKLLMVENELVEVIAALPGLRALETIWTTQPWDGELPAACSFRVGCPSKVCQPPDLPSIAHGEPSAILMTSGTTGPSKGALCPAAQFYWWAEYQSTGMRLSHDSVLFNALPLFHINAINTLVQSLLRGATCVIGERFSASTFWRTATETGATHSSLIGVMADFLLAQPKGEWDRAHQVRTVQASSVRADLWALLSERFGIPHRCGGYGSTETNLVFNSDDGWETPGNMGLPTAGFEVKVADAQDIAVPDGTAGELLVRSDVPHACFLSYWGNPEATVAACRNLWFHTGDLVVREATGRFRFAGRIKESIRRRGENISAWEVEQALLEHPAVAESAAFAVPSDVTGEEVMAVLVLKPQARVDFAELARFLESRLARFAIPRYLEVADSLPLTQTGKVDRSPLRRRGVTAATWDREAVLK